MKSKIVFLVTCIDGKNIENLLASISYNNSTLNCEIRVLFQNKLNISIEKYQTVYTRILPFYTESIIPLSRARNVLLKNIEIQPDIYYMFPDDDSIFDMYFFLFFERYVKMSSLIAVKGVDNDAYFLKMPNREYASKKDYHYAISVNIVVAGSVLLKVGGFDEELGVGNYYGAGEDNDFFIRCLKYTNFCFVNNLWNYHPIQKNKIDIPLRNLIQKYKSYGRGVVYMLLKNEMRLMALNIVIRGFLGMLKNFFKFNWRLAYVYWIATKVRLTTFIKYLILIK